MWSRWKEGAITLIDKHATNENTQKENNNLFHLRFALHMFGFVKHFHFIFIRVKLPVGVADWIEYMRSWQTVVDGIKVFFEIKGYPQRGDISQSVSISSKNYPLHTMRWDRYCMQSDALKHSSMRLLNRFHEVLTKSKYG